MDKNSIRKEIAALINSIKEHSDNIGTQEHIPQLELELILSKIEKLYQKSIVFNHLNSHPADFSSSQKPVENNHQTTPIVTVPQPQVVPEVQKEVLKPVDLFGSEIPAETAKAKAVKKEEVKEEKKETVAPPVVNKAPVSLQKPSIDDLRAAIGINDKFRFISELFQGNAAEYDVAVHQLNSSANLDSALEYFSNIQLLYNWDAENQSMKDLFELVERRYSR